MSIDTDVYCKREYALTKAYQRFPKVMYDFTGVRIWTQKRILLLDILLNRTDANGVISISGKEISNLAECSKDTFYGFISLLESAGAVSVQRERISYKRNAQNVYRFTHKLWYALSRLPHIARRLGVQIGDVYNNIHTHARPRTHTPESVGSIQQVNKLTPNHLQKSTKNTK